MKQCSIDDDLHFALAGHRSQPKLFQRDESKWLSAFWEKCYEQIGSVQGKIALVKVNKDRLETKKIAEGGGTAATGTAATGTAATGTAATAVQQCSVL